MKHTQKRSGRAALIGAALIGVLQVGAQQPVGQWELNSNLIGTGGALTYADGVGTGFQFGTTTGLGIANIGGTEASVLKVPGGPDVATGLSMPVPATANGGGSLVNDYTLIFDMLFPTASSGKIRAILETDAAVDPDAEIFVTNGNKFGGKGAFAYGAVTPDVWHRLGLVVNASAGQIRLYVDGVEGGVVLNPGFLDSRYSLTPGGVAGLFIDDNFETQPLYVNSIQLRNAALSKGQMMALGGAQAAGIPAVLPPVPSTIEQWIPASSVANRDTAVGAIINVGSTILQEASISLTLNGGAVAAPTIVRAGNLITVSKQPATPLSPGTDYTVVVTFTDSLAGVKSVTNKFNAAIFFENFNSLPLNAKVDEAGGSLSEEELLQAWTNRPPAGWLVDNSQFPATIISDENPDADGDGFADGDGRTEWAGWSFAKKDFWLTADQQNRQLFTLATGTVAIADPDEWDDSSHFKSLFNSFLKTPSISLVGIAAGKAFLKFDSSWRPEALDDVSPADSTTGFPGDYSNPESAKATNNQTAIITVSFDGGAPVQVLKWDSVDGSPTFHPDSENESVLVQLNNPAGAKNMVINFGMVNAANDWWWAIDNIAVSAGAAPPVFTQQPVGAEVSEGTKITFTAAASGEAVTYQWFKGFGAGKTAITGATSSTYQLASGKVENGGYYTVEAKNGAGTTPSSTVKLTVLPVVEGRLTLLSEDFEGLVLGPNQDEATVDETAWTHTTPAGWAIDNTGVPGIDSDADGVTEWAGWSFADKNFWAKAGGQNRAAFTKGIGTVAIGDSDEWDDVSHAAGDMATYLKTKNISLAGTKANSVVIMFDSSWNPEAPQKANIVVSFDGGAPIEVKRYESDPASASYHPAELNETLAFRVNNPAGATNMTLTVGYFETRNNWWFAFDNLKVLASPAPIFFEDFEGLVLRPNIDEGINTSPAQAVAAAWTKTGPAGWTIDDTGVPGVGTAQDGVTEWAGWSFAKKEFWATAGGQNRADFTLGTGTLAIADSDEWDDVAHAAGNMATFLATPAISIASTTANSLYLSFSSSFRAEVPQKASVKASFDGGPAVDVIQWVSEPAVAGKFHDNRNESVTVPLYNPAGAKTVKLTFGYFETRNNWWWAVDNIEVSVGAVAPSQGPAINPAPNIPGLTGGTFTDVQTDTGAKTLSVKLPTTGEQGFLTITPGVTVKSVKIVGDRLLISYE